MLHDQQAAGDGALEPALVALGEADLARLVALRADLPNLLVTVAAEMLAELLEPSQYRATGRALPDADALEAAVRLLDQILVPVSANLAYAVFLFLLAGATAARKKIAWWLVVVYLGIGPMMALGTDLVVGAAPPERAGSAAATVRRCATQSRAMSSHTTNTSRARGSVNT